MLLAGDPTATRSGGRSAVDRGELETRLWAMLRKLERLD